MFILNQATIYKIAWIFYIKCKKCNIECCPNPICPLFDEQNISVVAGAYVAWRSN